MSTDRMTRVNELLRREIAAALFPVLSADERVELSALTVTRVAASRSLRHARVFVSVRGTPAEQAAALRRLGRCRHAIQDLINRNLTLKYTPQLIFELDTAVAQGDRVLDMLTRLEQETSRAAAEHAGPADEEHHDEPTPRA